MDSTYKDGLEDVIAARSAGRLYDRGYEIGDLAGTVPFEDVTFLLWRGELPTAREAADFRARTQAERGLPAPIVNLLDALPRDCHPLDALRTAVSLAAALDPDVRVSDAEANVRKSLRLLNRIPEIVAAWLYWDRSSLLLDAPTTTIPGVVRPWLAG